MLDRGDMAMRFGAPCACVIELMSSNATTGIQIFRCLIRGCVQVDLSAEPEKATRQVPKTISDRSGPLWHIEGFLKQSALTLRSLLIDFPGLSFAKVEESIDPGK